VLAGARLGDEALLAHAHGEEGLTQDVVDLVRPGVVEIFPLEQHPHAERFAEIAALRQRRGASGIVLQ
jgi:hypothetical protein